MRFRAGAASALTCALLGALPVAAPADARCSSDTFVVESAPLILQVCDVATARPATGGNVEETLSVKGRSALVRGVRYERLAGEDVAHAVDDVPLAGLGIAKTMHVTLAVRGGTARIEHVLLVPGALSLK